MADTWRESNSMETVQVSWSDDAVSARLAAEEALSRWKTGETPDAQAVLERHPHLQCDKSLVLDLACEEFWHRKAAGEELDPQSFSGRFPAYRASLVRLLQVQHYFAENPHLDEIQEPPWPELNSTFLGFPLLEDLGRGAFAQVYLAMEPKLSNRRVALKVSPQGMQEAERLGKLRHPNIVPVYRVEQDPDTGLTAVCMPYLGRATLCDVLDLAFGQPGWPASANVILNGAQSYETDESDSESTDPWLTAGTYIDGVLRLGQLLALALHYTHQMGMYHLDLKPSNVLLTPSGRPLLLDFNLAVERDAPMTRIGGTLPYMSPEQIQASVLRQADAVVDQRSDVFSLGVILYELLCGTLPFGSLPWKPCPRAVGECLLDRQRRGPRPLAEQNTFVNRSLAQLVERTLAWDPARRPPTAGELAEQLAAQLGSTARARRWLRSHRRSVYSGILFAALASGATAGWALSRDPYWVRMYRDAQSKVAAGDYPQALGSLDASLKDHPAEASVLRLRGHVHQTLGNYLAASADYSAACRYVDDPLLQARRGYCLAMAESYPGATSAFQAAIDGGYKSPHLFCDMGRCYERDGQFARAEWAYSEALKLDARCGLAYLGRAAAEVHRSAANNDSASARSLADIERAFELLPASSELLGIGALAYAQASPNAQHMARSLELVEQAARLGFNPSSWQPMFREVGKQPRFAELCERNQSNRPPSFPWIVDPLLDDEFPNRP